MDENGNPQVFTQALAPGPELDPIRAAYQAQLDAINARASARRPGLSAEERRRRVGQNDLDAQFGQLLMLSGDEGAQALGAPVLKQALAMRTPQVTERGMANPLTGEFDYDPDYLQRQDDASRSAIENHIAEARIREQQAKEQRDFMQEEHRLNRENARINAGIMANRQDQKLPTDIVGMAISFDTMRDNISNLTKALGDFDPQNLNDQADFSKRADLESLHAALLFSAKEAARLGALTGPDVDLVEKMVTPPTSAEAFKIGKKGLLIKYQNALKWIESRSAATRRQFPNAQGLNPPTAAPRAATAASAASTPAPMLEGDASDLKPTRALPRAVAASGG